MSCDYNPSESLEWIVSRRCFNNTAINFEDYNDGCIELVFSLPTIILEYYSPNSPLFTYIDWKNQNKVAKSILT